MDPLARAKEAYERKAQWLRCRRRPRAVQAGRRREHPQTRDDDLHRTARTRETAGIGRTARTACIHRDLRQGDRERRVHGLLQRNHRAFLTESDGSTPELGGTSESVTGWRAP